MVPRSSVNCFNLTFFVCCWYPRRLLREIQACCLALQNTCFSHIVIVKVKTWLAHKFDPWTSYTSSISDTVERHTSQVFKVVTNFDASLKCNPKLIKFTHMQIKLQVLSVFISLLYPVKSDFLDFLKYLSQSFN